MNMEKRVASIEFEFLGTQYRATRHFNANLIELERSVPKRIMKSGFVWERIYFGHTNPLQEALSLFDSVSQEKAAAEITKE